MIAFILSVLLCVNSIFSVWSKWRANPVVVSIDNIPISVGLIPFPAITICPLTKTAVKKFNFTDTYRAVFKLGENLRNVTEHE